MAQLLQIHPSVTSIGACEFLADIPDASNGKLSVQSDVMRGITEMKVLEAELNEHRYHLERKVEERTEQLVRRITLLESCNGTLCDKLAQARKDIAALRKQLAATLSDAGSIDCLGQLAA